MKTFDREDVYSVLNAEKAQEYEGKLGYFGDSLSEISSLIQGYAPNVLDTIYPNDKKPFRHRGLSFLYFLPADRVKNPKCRPFKSWEEFKSVTNLDVGSIIYLQPKGNDDLYYEVRTIDMLRVFKDRTLIGFSHIPNLFDFKKLFEDYAFKTNTAAIWQPFGVLEND